MTPAIVRSVIALVATVALTRTAGAQTTIDFNDGTNRGAIGTFYSGLGVTFQNAQWDNFVSPNEAAVGASGLKLIAINSTYGPTPGTAIVALFANPLTSVSVRGLNVGENGARIDAYDALVGGSIVGSNQAFGVGAGTDNHPLLQVSGVGIRRIELYQPASVQVEGLLFDNLTFTAGTQSTVPEPGSLALVATGVLAVCGWRVRRAHARRI
jgi:hypothetical protein